MIYFTKIYFKEVSEDRNVILQAHIF